MCDSTLPSAYLQNQIYREEVKDSVYWQHRGQYHRKLIHKDDEEGVRAAVQSAASRIIEADALLFITGAGCGVDMGLADFRSSQTFWKELKHPQIKRYEDFSDAKWFEEDPELAWGVNMHQISSYRCAEPHEGYKAMLKLGSMKDNNYFCFTSNIDGVLQRTGFDTHKVREVHGNIHRLQCTDYDCLTSKGDRIAWPSAVDLSYDKSTYRATGPFPRCHNCSRIARPNVWFCSDSAYVQYSNSKEISDDYFRFIHRQEKNNKKVCVLDIGNGLVIPTGRIEAELMCEQLPNATLIRINPVDYMVPVDHDNDSEKNDAIGIPLGAKAGVVSILESVETLLK